MFVILTLRNKNQILLNYKDIVRATEFIELDEDEKERVLVSLTVVKYLGSEVGYDTVIVRNSLQEIEKILNSNYSFSVTYPSLGYYPPASDKATISIPTIFECNPNDVKLIDNEYKLFQVTND